MEQCQHEGLAWGQELYFDGTKVVANAGKESLYQVGATDPDATVMQTNGGVDLGYHWSQSQTLAKKAWSGSSSLPSGGATCSSIWLLLGVYLHFFEYLSISW